ncbi:MAG: hypothetical protein KGI75_00940 [Rhizobiaceae bacterium]|nr:hypothetical protein [Rhizobiaceae bacterium]
MSSNDSFLSGFGPFAFAFLAMTALSTQLDITSFQWIGYGLCVAAVLLAIHFGHRASGTALLGVTIGGYIMGAVYATVGPDQLSMPIESYPGFFLTFVAVIVGFPLGVLVRVSFSGSAAGIPSALIFGVVSCLYFPVALGIYDELGLPGWLIQPFNPWFQFGASMHLDNGPGLLLNIFGACIAAGIALLVLTWPLFLTLGSVAIALGKSEH